MDTDSLLDFVEAVTGESHHRVEQDFGFGYVRLDSAEAERRQAQHDIRNVEDMVIELLRNARDAGASTVFVATNQSTHQRQLTVIDDGAGIPSSLHKLIFEPRVTNKLNSCHIDRWGVHGRGMALYSIAANSLAAEVLASEEQRGSSIAVRVDLDRVSERRDQSSLPQLIREGERTIFRGPRNIQRIVGEFAVEERDRCTVFLGSPVEIAATLVDLGRRVLSPHERSFGRPSEHPLLFGPAFAIDSDELSRQCESLGLSLSIRSARRILDGDVRPLDPFIRQLFATSAPKVGQTDKIHGTRSKLPRGKAVGSSTFHGATTHFSAADLTNFRQQVEQAFEELAAPYYLETDVEARISQENHELHLRIPLEELASS